MKRKGYLYQNLYKFENIQSTFNEVCKNTKNKKKVARFKEYKCIYISRIYNILQTKTYKVARFKEYKCIYISRIYNILQTKTYKPGPYNVFTIYEPKKRRIVSQNMQDKVINHLVARHILYPALLPCLLDVNVASRKGLGTSEGIRLAMNFNRICKLKYKTFYILKCDISKFFASINHDILKEK